MIQIYGLYDPETAELRYVGKAKNAGDRLVRHLQEARRGTRPVHAWLRKLSAAEKLPAVKILAEVADDQWEAEERRLIAEHRKTADLLNLADGGAMPSQTAEQRKAAARASNRKQQANPALEKFNKAKLEMSKLHASYMKRGRFFHAYTLRFRMRCWAAYMPDLCSGWTRL